MLLRLPLILNLGGLFRDRRLSGVLLQDCCADGFALGSRLVVG